MPKHKNTPDEDTQIELPIGLIIIETLIALGALIVLAIVIGYILSRA